MTTKHTSGSPASWKARREAYRKTQGPVSNGGFSMTNRKWRREVKFYRQSIHCGCGQCLPGQDRECPAREPNIVDPRD